MAHSATAIAFTSLPSLPFIYNSTALTNPIHAALTNPIHATLRFDRLIIKYGIVCFFGFETDLISTATYL